MGHAALDRQAPPPAKHNQKPAIFAAAKRLGKQQRTFACKFRFVSEGCPVTKKAHITRPKRCVGGIDNRESLAAAIAFGIPSLTESSQLEKGKQGQSVDATISWGRTEVKVCDRPKVMETESSASPRLTHGMLPCCREGLPGLLICGQYSRARSHVQLCYAQLRGEFGETLLLYIGEQLLLYIMSW